MEKLTLKSAFVKGRMLTREQLKKITGGKKQQVNCNSAALGTYECLSGSLQACRDACYERLVDCTGCD